MTLEGPDDAGIFNDFPCNRGVATTCPVRGGIDDKKLADGRRQLRYPTSFGHKQRKGAQPRPGHERLGNPLGNAVPFLSWIRGEQVQPIATKHLHCRCNGMSVEHDVGVDEDEDASGGLL
jgi:hypothetical protein